MSCSSVLFLISNKRCMYKNSFFNLHILKCWVEDLQRVRAGGCDVVARLLNGGRSGCISMWCWWRHDEVVVTRCSLGLGN
ncbi:hypothetical protein Hdeb2414_s0009g00327921 [Helianthus debilis subsp. tardiflorus]